MHVAIIGGGIEELSLVLYLHRENIDARSMKRPAVTDHSALASNRYCMRRASWLSSVSAPIYGKLAQSRPSSPFKIDTSN